jgi:hypothetical protein
MYSIIRDDRRGIEPLATIALLDDNLSGAAAREAASSLITLGGSSDSPVAVAAKAVSPECAASKASRSPVPAAMLPTYSFKLKDSGQMERYTKLRNMYSSPGATEAEHLALIIAQVLRCAAYSLLHCCLNYREERNRCLIPK